MAGNRRAARLAGLAVAGVSLFFFVTGVVTRYGADAPPGRHVTETRLTLGLPFSPRFELTTRDEWADRPDGGFTGRKSEHGQIRWGSWSWLLLAGVAAGVVAFRRLKPAATGRPEA